MPAPIVMITIHNNNAPTPPTATEAPATTTHTAVRAMAFVLTPPFLHRPCARPAACTTSLQNSSFTPLPALAPHIHRTRLPPPRRRPQSPVCRVPSVSPRPPRSVLTILSTIVGVCVLIGSILYKIPQVFRVVRRRSAAGISILMYALETIGTTFSAVYFARRAFPFATYGESVFIMGQNVLLMALIVFFQRLPRAPAFACAALYAVALVLLYSKLVPLSVLMALQVCSIPILNLARVPQILLNWRRKSTGELSPVTLGLQLLGNVARIFTTVAQVRDPLMFAGICVATCFNGTLFVQWLYYSGKLKNVANQVPNA